MQKFVQELRALNKNNPHADAIINNMEIYKVSKPGITQKQRRTKLKTTIIISEQHTLLPEQESILKEKFAVWTTIFIPEKGWTKEERDIICETLRGDVVFVSPLSGMLVHLSRRSEFEAITLGSPTVRPWVFSNDTMEKITAPNGTVILVTAQTGWYLE